MANSEEHDGEQVDALEPLKRDPEDIRNIIKAVLTLENEYLNQQKPHLNEDVIRIIKEQIR